MRFRFRQPNQLVADPMEDLSRKVRIGYRAGEIEGSEQSAENKQRTSALILAARWKQGAEESQAPLHPFGVKSPRGFAPAGDVAQQRSHWTAGSRRIAVCLGQVVLEKMRHVWRMLFPNVKVLECRRQRLHDQFIARSEVFVETSNRHARFLHHIGNADAFETTFTKSLGGHFDDPSVCRRLVTL